MTTSKNSSQVSKFYLACRNGDVDFVKEYLKTSPVSESDLNQMEPNVNSTPLHAASYYGHKEIVHLLIEHGCDRSQMNGHGLTAYEEAANDEIRQLFKRPTNGSNVRRFEDETTDNCFDFVKRPQENIEEVASPTTQPLSKITKTPSVQGYKTKAEKQLEIGYATTSIAMCQSKLGRFITNKFQHNSPLSLESMGNRLQDIIDKEIIADKDPQSQKANDLVKKFLIDDDDQKRIEHLIRLYTLETKFYHVLKQNPMPLALPLYTATQTLKDRYFQGQSYRGAKMDDDDIATYQWAVKNHGSLLQTRHFSSTSLKRSVAEEFSTVVPEKVVNNRRNSVLFVFNFPERCDQAINLSRISEEQACLSEFEDEAEILILPWTLFRVDSVEKESSTSSYTICLSNILLPHKSVMSSLKWILKHPKGSIDRFHEHFPEKQPKIIVEQLMANFSISDEDIFKKKEK